MDVVSLVDFLVCAYKKVGIKNPKRIVLSIKKFELVHEKEKYIIVLYLLLK